MKEYEIFQCRHDEDIHACLKRLIRGARTNDCNLVPSARGTHRIECKP